VADCSLSEPFALQITDASMAPELPCGCVVIVDPGGIVRDGALVLAEHEADLLVRRLRVAGPDVRLEPLDPAFETVVPAGGLACVRGVVVQRAGARRSAHRHYG